MTLEFDASDFFRHVDFTDMRVKKAVKTGMDDAVDDLARISQNIAPIDEGTLRRSVDRRKRVYWSKINGAMTGTVSFGATEESSGYGRFNYAIWTHEMEYNLGTKSEQAPGTDGYAVGNKYLERPLKGESGKYVKWWKEEVERALK